MFPQEPLHRLIELSLPLRGCRHDRRRARRRASSWRSRCGAARRRSGVPAHRFLRIPTASDSDVGKRVAQVLSGRTGHGAEADRVELQHARRESIGRVPDATTRTSTGLARPRCSAVRRSAHRQGVRIARRRTTVRSSRYRQARWRYRAMWMRLVGVVRKRGASAKVVDESAGVGWRVVATPGDVLVGRTSRRRWRPPGSGSWAVRSTRESGTLRRCA